MQETELFMPIYDAITQGRLEDVIRLIGGNRSRLEMVTPLNTWLHVAASHGQLEIVRWLVSQGLDVNAYGGTIEVRPLDSAAAEGQLEVARFLLDSGATLDVTDSVRNPLFSAIVGGLSEAHTAVAKLLIERGIDTTAKYNIGQMKNVDALAFAKEWGRTDIVKLLEAK